MSNNREVAVLPSFSASFSEEIDPSNMTMNVQSLSFSPLAKQKEQELFKDIHYEPTKYNPKPMVESSKFNIPTNAESNTTGCKVYKTDYNRRARNVISSRKYRKKRKLQFEKLERDNKLLQNAIVEAEKIHHELNEAFRMLIQHAELCNHCCNITL